MRLGVALQGDLARFMREESAPAERAVTAGMSEASADLKTDLRRQITSAGLGERLARTWRSEVYPKGRKSIGAAGFVWSKAPDIVRTFDQGAVIRSKRGLFLACPAGAGRQTRPQRRRVKLRFVSGAAPPRCWSSTTSGSPKAVASSPM